MPSMYVNVPKLPQETKDTLVAKLYEAAAPVLKAPHIYTFVNEYETLYENGKPAPQQMVVANLEAGPTKEEKVNALAEGMRAAGSAVLVVSGKSGVAVGAEKGFKAASKKGIAKLFFVNEMDNENADFYKVFEELKTKFGPMVCPMVVPYVVDRKVQCYINLLEYKA